jgi:hypothetical protein
MKKYKHIPSGRVYNRDGLFYIDESLLYASVPISIVEDPNSKDWQEIKEEVVPPGIESWNLYGKGNSYWQTKSFVGSYDEIVRHNLEQGHTIHKIKDLSGREWSVDEWISLFVNDSWRQEQIESFAWNAAFGWTFIPKAYDHSFLFSSANKLHTHLSLEERVAILENDLKEIFAMNKIK